MKIIDDVIPLHIQNELEKNYGYSLSLESFQTI